MHRMWMTVLGVAGLLAACAANAVAQEVSVTRPRKTVLVEVPSGERLESDIVGTKLVGKNTVLVHYRRVPVQESETALVEVPRGERKEGDLVGTKRVGKNTELVFYRRVAVQEPAVAKGHACTTRTALVGKNTELRHLCVVDGAERPCPGMNDKGECLATK